MTDTALNEIGTSIVQSMFVTWQTLGPKAAKELLRRNRERWGRKHVDEVTHLWMAERKTEFDSVSKWIELKDWASENFPIHGHHGRCRRPANRRRP